LISRKLWASTLAKILQVQSGRRLRDIDYRIRYARPKDRSNGLISNHSKILAVVCDNASNNDTMVTVLEERFRAVGIPFIAKHARLRCMPHTTHLAACKVQLSTHLTAVQNAHHQQTSFSKQLALCPPRNCQQPGPVHLITTRIPLPNPLTPMLMISSPA
jgi:hypothetical protein